MLDTLGNLGPFLFELEALVVVLDTPLLLTGFDLSGRRLGSGWLSFLLNFFREVGDARVNKLGRTDVLSQTMLQTSLA